MFKCVNCGCNMMFSRCDGDKEVWVCSDCGTINNNNFLAEFQRGYKQALDDVLAKIKEPTEVKISHWQEHDVIDSRQREIIKKIKKLKDGVENDN